MIATGNHSIIPENTIELKVGEAVLAERVKNFVPKKKELSGCLKRYATFVAALYEANRGNITEYGFLIMKEKSFRMQLPSLYATAA